VAASTHFPKLVGSDEVDGVSGRARGGVEPKAPTPALALDFDDVYRDHFAFVWRSAKRLGVRDAALDDVVQEVFVIVHRRLDHFEGRSTLKTWLFGITLRVVRDHKRSVARKTPETRAANADDASHREVDPDTLRAPTPTPSESVERAEAVRVLHALLDELPDERREIFVMAELEQMSMPEIAPTLGINVNTAYARLRAARQDFEAALQRHRARQERLAKHPRPALPPSAQGRPR
jgi:RNA polymerase sigma-70 factor (ECF subfamily)